MKNFKQKLFLNIIILLILNIGLFYFNEASAQSVDIIVEKIISYQSYIEVQPDASMVVTETIRVVALGDKIKHGIYRDFPTKYTDIYGNKYAMDFKVLIVSKDGVRENYWTESLSNGVRVYIGDKNALIPLGEHVYEITYKTNRQLGFFKDHDELYWNVTGNGWEFDIDYASAILVLPNGASDKIISTQGYTGTFGEKGKDFVVSRDSFGNLFLYTTKPLNPGEGLSIVTSWPRGYVKAPTVNVKIGYFLQDNLGALICVAGLMIILLYYVRAWNKYGKDPQKGTIIAQYEPPTDLSPAAVRYVLRMGFDKKAFTATVISLAVKGCLKIKEEKAFLSKTYTLSREDSGKEKLTDDEAKTKNQLFGLYTEVKLEKTNYLIIEDAVDVLEKALKRNYEKKFFVTNTSQMGRGFGLSLFFFFLAFALGGLALPISVFYILASVLINVFFLHFMKAPTQDGRKIMDKIEGFKLFLSVTEKDRLNFFNPPEKTPELFEKFLPYALALDVENKWAEQFADVFAKITEENKQYAPSWYYGTSFAIFNTNSFTSNLSNSFSNAIASSSVPPGSSSGFGGGGSGGGGGGGGGGGW